MKMKNLFGICKKLKESIVEFNDNNNSDNRFEIFTEFGRSMIQKCVG